MFFDMIIRNSKRSRRENGIYFSTLLAAVVSFYIILSLENQDVMVFLRSMEGDAVRRLLKMIPIVYGVSLVLVFFLVYFASRYQMERRSRDYGVYLLLGMRKYKLFMMVLAEDMISSFTALAVGLPVSVLISEVVGLAVSRVIGLGIIGHHFTISLKAVLLTVTGFAGVKFLALFLLSGRLAGSELLALLKDTQEEKQKVRKRGVSGIRLTVGILMLLAAYGLAISGLAWSDITAMTITVFLGIWGTFLLFQGLNALVEIMTEQKLGWRGLSVFTYRQLQENVFLKSSSLAVSSLLVLAALACAAVGISMGLNARGMDHHAVDFTFTGEEAAIKERLSAPDTAQYVGELFEVKTGLFWTESVEGEDREHTFDASGLLQSVQELPVTEGSSILLNNLQYFTSPRLIALSGYNEMLKLGGREPIALQPGEIMLYTDADSGNLAISETLLMALQSRPVLVLDGKEYRLCSQTVNDNLVVDRSITVLFGLILPDEDFEAFMSSGEGVSSFWNMTLQEDVVKKEGMMQAIAQMNELLKNSGFTTESYLQNIGRQAFYVVGAGYLTVYLALIFLMIANTVIGVQFLMQEKKTGKRYQTLVALGSEYKEICKSARTQIKWCFGLPVGVAAASSLFGIPSLLAGLMTSALKSQAGMLVLSGILVMLCLCLIEGIYIIVVMKHSDRHLAALMELERDM